MANASGPTAILNALKKLGELRDGILIVVTALYLLGYATWSAYAWQERLGPVAALDAQYFAAGVPIAMLLSLTLGAIIGLRRLADTYWRRYIERQNPNRRWWIALGLVLVAIALTVTAVVVFRAKPAPLQTGPILLVTAAYVLVHLHGAQSDKPDRFARFAPSIVLVLVGAWSVVGFATVVYPAIPVALGGGRPQKVTLDIRVDAVAPATVRQLLEPGMQAPATGIVQTRQVSLVPSRGDYYLILIPERPYDQVVLRVQLARSAVQAITWRQ